VSSLLQGLGLASFERWLRAKLGEKINLLPADNRTAFPHGVDWPHTQAYSYGYHGQIFLNVRGREPSGIVEADTDYPQLISAIEKDLRAMIDPADGQPLVSDIIQQRDAFQGPYAHLGADLVIVMRGMSYITRQGYEFSNKSGSFLSHPSTYESGSHRIDGLLFVGGPSFRSLGNLASHSIIDLAPTIMYIFGLNAEGKMDGKILLDESNVVNNNPTNLSYVYSDSNSPQGDQFLSKEEEDELTERLKNLGYLG
jgi:predicted AlkP superfamily phosphohydrolase/phosphomutase